MKQLLLLLLMANLPCLVFAQEIQKEFGSISGVVVSLDEIQCQYVNVVIKNTKTGTITDEQGNFNFKKIQTGRYILNFSLLGHADTSIAVDVNPGENVFIKVQLVNTYSELRSVIVRAGMNRYVETRTSASLRMNLPLLEVPQSITVNTKELLTDQGLIGTLEATRNASGIQTIIKSFNDYSLAIRGVDATWNVFRNGIGGGIYWWNQQEDAAMIEKIEYIKGPAGFMISMAEPGGFLNIVTKQPVKEKLADFNVGFGSFNLKRISADIGGVIDKSGKLSYRLNTGAHWQQTHFQFGKARRYFICPVLKYDFNLKTSITAEYNYMRGVTQGNNYDLPSIDGNMFSLPWDFAAADAKTSYLTVFDNCIRIQANHKFSESWNLYAQAAYVNGLWEGHFLYANADIPVTNDTLYRAASVDDYRNHAYSFQVFTEKKFGKGKVTHQALAGIDYVNGGFTQTSEWNWDQGFGLYLSNPEYAIPPNSFQGLPMVDYYRLKSWWVGFYMQDHLKIADKLVLTLAGRFNHSFVNLINPGIPEDQRQNIYNILTPRTGITWLFSNDMSVYALYEKSFWPQFGKLVDGSLVKPLSGYNLETGFKSYILKRRFNLNASVFHLVKNNIINNDPVNNGYVIQRGQVTSKGFEIDATGNITNAIVLNMNYGFADAKITKDTDSTLVGLKNFGVPDHNANLWVKYKILYGMLKGFSTGLGYQFTGKRSAVWYYNPDPDTKYLPVYHLVSASLNYDCEKFSAGINVYNITNSKYAATGFYSYVNEWRYTSGEPINFRVNFTFRLFTLKKE